MVSCPALRSVGRLECLCHGNKIPKELELWKWLLSRELSVNMGVKDHLGGESVAAQGIELLNHCLRHADCAHLSGDH